MKKQIISLIACGAIAASATLGLAACGGDDNSLTVWAPQTHQTMLREMIEEFKTQNPDITLDIKPGVCGESDAYAQFSKDASACADVYGFANDQLINLNTIKALARLGDSAVEEIKANNDEGSVASAKIGDYYYGYPYASDNGFFLYYDKTVVKEESAGSLEAILDDCLANGKYLVFNQKEAWYVGSFFFGCGGDYNVTWDGSVSTSTTNFDQKPAGEEYTYGQIGGMAHIDLNKHKGFQNGDDTVISQYINGNKLGAVITGTWNAKLISEKWGDNMVATKLPKFKSSLTNKEYQMNSFIGYKLYGVNPNSKHLTEAHKLASFLANQQMQEKRFDTLQIGPSNKVVAEMQKVKDNKALAGFRAQREAEGGVKIQDALPSSYWDAMKGFGESVNGSKPEIKDLDTLNTALDTLIKALKDE